MSISHGKLRVREFNSTLTLKIRFAVVLQKLEKKKKLLLWYGVSCMNPMEFFQTKGYYKLWACKIGGVVIA